MTLATRRSLLEGRGAPAAYGEKTPRWAAGQRGDVACIVDTMKVEISICSTPSGAFGEVDR